jgi:hypothetical protein
MRNAFTGWAAAGVLLLLAGCSHATTSPAVAPPRAPTPVPPQSAAPSPAAVPTAASTLSASAAPHGAATTATEIATVGGMARFVAAVQRRLPSVALDRRDDEVEELGEQVCDSVAAGKRTATVEGEIREFGVGKSDARTLVALAQDTACRSGR